MFLRTYISAPPHQHDQATTLSTRTESRRIASSLRTIRYQARFHPRVQYLLCRTQESHLRESLFRGSAGTIPSCSGPSPRSHHHRVPPPLRRRCPAPYTLGASPLWMDKLPGTSSSSGEHKGLAEPFDLSCDLSRVRDNSQPSNQLKIE